MTDLRRWIRWHEGAIILVVLFLFLVLAVLWLGANPAHGHDWSHSRWAGLTTEQKACIYNMQNRDGYQCCGHDDADSAEVKWSYGKNSFEVELKNPLTGEVRTYPIPREAEVVNGEKCGVGGAMVWWHPQYEPEGDMTPVFRCFKPGAGG